MKVIDLLNKIANGKEVPKKFTYKGYLWEYDVKNKMWFYYFGKSKNHRFDRLFYLNIILNDEIEIIDTPKEDKKIPEKLPTWFSLEMSHNKDNIEYANANFENMYDKINEIIDYLKSKGE